MPWIECGSLSFYIIYPFLLPLCWTGRLFLNTLLSGQEGKVNPFTLIFFSFLPNVFFSIEYFFKQFQQMDSRKRNSNKTTIKKKLFSVIVSKDVLEHSYIPYILLFISSICECVFVTGFFFIKFLVTESIIFFEMNVTLILISTVTTRFILHYPIYRHQVVAIIVVSLNLFLIFIQQSFFVSDSADNLDQTTNNIKLFFIFFGLYCVIALLDSIQKFLMEKKFYSPSKIIFLQGTSSTIIYLILLLFAFEHISCDTLGEQGSRYTYCDNGYFGNIAYAMNTLFDTLEGVKIFYFILYLIICCCYMLCLLSTNKHFTPTHRCFSETLGAFIYWIIELIGIAPQSLQQQQTKFDVFVLCRLIMLLVSSLVYNDVIILNFCGLGLNTRKKIIQRSSFELSEIKEVIIYEEDNENNIELEEGNNNQSAIGLNELNHEN